MVQFHPVLPWRNGNDGELRQTVNLFSYRLGSSNLSSFTVRFELSYILTCMEKFFIVYKTTNTKNGKFYVGVHTSKSLDDKYLGSGSRLKNEIKKYGLSSFKREIIAVFDNPEEMFSLESEIVNEQLILDEQCLNLKEGGNGGWNFVNSLPEKKEFYNSEDQKSRSPFCNPEWRILNKEKISEWSRNSKGFEGKKHTSAYKSHMSEIMKEKQQGEKNSQYGKVWISHSELKLSKKINGSEIEDWLEKGWKKGRRMKF